MKRLKFIRHIPSLTDMTFTLKNFFLQKAYHGVLCRLTSFSLSCFLDKQFVNQILSWMKMLERLISADDTLTGHIFSYYSFLSFHGTFEAFTTVCPGSNDLPEKIFNIFASANKVYTIYWLLRYFRVNIIRLQSK